MAPIATLMAAVCMMSKFQEPIRLKWKLKAFWESVYSDHLFRVLLQRINITLAFLASLRANFKLFPRICSIIQYNRPNRLFGTLAEVYNWIVADIYIYSIIYNLLLSAYDARNSLISYQMYTTQEGARVFYI